MPDSQELIFLIHTERTLLVTLLEDRLTMLIDMLRRTEGTGEHQLIRTQVKTTVSLLDKLHRAAAVSLHGIPAIKDKTEA